MGLIKTHTMQLTKPISIQGKICFRVLILSQFIKHTAEYGLTWDMPRLIPQAYNYTINAAKNITKQVLMAYPDSAASQINYHITTERINDISLILDELVDAENIDELLTLIKQNKK